MVWVQLGYPVVIFMAALQRVDPELYEAAELDGANWFQRFRSITVSHHPARDLRGDAHLHDRRAQGVRPDLHADPRRPRQRDHRAQLLLVQRVLPEPAGGLRRHHRDRADRRHRRRRDPLHQRPEPGRAQRRTSADVATIAPDTRRPRRSSDDRRQGAPPPSCASARSQAQDRRRLDHPRSSRSSSAWSSPCRSC